MKILTAKCKICTGKMESEHGGHFSKCSCGSSFIDRDRHAPDRYRVGGFAIEAQFIEKSQKLDTL